MQDTRFILKYFPPAGFPKRRKKDTGTCANYTLKAVIEAKTGENRKLKDYADGWWSYISNFMTPRSLTSVLKKYNMKYKVLRYRFIKKAERLKYLKTEILGGPIILATANGLTKNKYFSWKKHGLIGIIFLYGDLMMKSNVFMCMILHVRWSWIQT